jgi:tetratricopeptide (TPR) repeat protein
MPCARFYTALGWFYVDVKRWFDALSAFESAKEEDPDYFGNYWGVGRTQYELGNYESAIDALRVALEKGPNLGPPASDEIPDLLNQCLRRLNVDVEGQADLKDG